MDDYEELQRMLAQLVVWMRSEATCPHHYCVSVIYFGHDGPFEWHGPACEVEDGLLTDCEWREHRNELIEMATDRLGTRDMSTFLP